MSMKDTLSQLGDILDILMFHGRHEANLFWERISDIPLLQFPMMIMSAIFLPILCHLLFPFWIFLFGIAPFIITWTAYSIFGRTQHSSSGKHEKTSIPPFPVNLMRVFKVNMYLLWQIRRYFIYPRPQLRTQAFQRNLGSWNSLSRWLKGLKGSREYTRHNIHYGSKCSDNRLDVYGTSIENREHPSYLSRLPNRRPVIVFVAGDNWQFGDKSDFDMVARNLNKQGYIVVIPNYTKWPKGKLNDMISDMEMVIEWCFTNIKSYGGDPFNITIMAHSTGAHLVAMALLRHAVYEGQKDLDMMLSRSDVSPHADGIPDIPLSRHPLSSVYGVVLMSGVFDTAEQYEFESIHGIEDLSCLGRLISEGLSHPYLGHRLTSPTCIIYDSLHLIEAGVFSTHLPQHWLLLHGHRDEVVPFSSTLNFFEALNEAGVDHIVLKTFDEPDHGKLVWDMMFDASNEKPNPFNPHHRHHFNNTGQPILLTRREAREKLLDASRMDMDVELTEFFGRCARIGRYKAWLDVQEEDIDPSDPTTFMEFEYSERVGRIQSNHPEVSDDLEEEESNDSISSDGMSLPEVAALIDERNEAQMTAAASVIQGRLSDHLAIERGALR